MTVLYILLLISIMFILILYVRSGVYIIENNQKYKVIGPNAFVIQFGISRIVINFDKEEQRGIYFLGAIPTVNWETHEISGWKINNLQRKKI